MPFTEVTGNLMEVRGGSLTVAVESTLLVALAIPLGHHPAPCTHQREDNTPLARHLVHCTLLAAMVLQVPPVHLVVLSTLLVFNQVVHNIAILLEVQVVSHILQEVMDLLVTPRDLMEGVLDTLQDCPSALPTRRTQDNTAQ